MSCTPTPTATLYATVSSFVPSTSYAQSTASTGVQMTIVVQPSCATSGIVNGSSVGCISTVQVTRTSTVGDDTQAAQVPIVVSVPITETHPTRTLFAPCPSGGGSSSGSQTPGQSSTSIPLTTSVLVQSTPPPSTVIVPSSTTLADGSVVQTVVTVVTTPAPTSVYVPTSLANPSLQGDGSQGSGTDVAPIVGGVLGGFLGLIAVVGSLWWFCRRRRSWDDIFEKEALQNDDAWVPTVSARHERGSRRPDSSADPKPYQYGLVGHVIPPAAAGEPLRTSPHGSISEHSGMHSRNTSLSAMPLLQGTYTGSSRPSTAGSGLNVQTLPDSTVLSSVGSMERNPRSVSMASQSNNMGPPLDDQLSPTLLDTGTPITGNLAGFESLDRFGSPVSSTERRVLQIVNNDPPSPTDTIAPEVRRTSSRLSSRVIVHTDAGRVPESSLTNPPAYSR